MPISRRVRVQNRQRRLSVDSRALARAMRRVLDGEGADPTAQLGLVLLRDGPMATLNARYRDRAGPTDVLSFPGDPEGWPEEEPPWLGEVVVSVDRALAQAGERRLPVAEELARLCVHGVLHLLGYRDDTPAARARMRRREARYLQAFTGGR